MSALFLSTDTLDKPLEGYAAHRKTPPSTDSLTQRSYLTHNKTTAIPNGTAAATVVRREAPHASQSRSIRREARSAKRAAGTNPIQNARSAPLFPQPVIRRKPDIAGAAVCLLSGALRRTQEALAARSAQRGLLACPRTRREGTCSPPGQERLITRRCKPSCAYPRQHRTGCPSGSRGASSSQDRSRCSQPGRSQSRRHRRPCCRSRRPGR